MIIIKPGSHAYRIVKLLLYTGEFPYYSLGMLGNVRMMKNVVNRMAESHEVRNDSGKTIFQGKILNISGKGQFKTIRLNAYAFKIIDVLFFLLLIQWMRSYILRYGILVTVMKCSIT